jgi:hypothetical protein
VVPEDPVIQLVGGSRIRAGLAIAVAGAGLTAFCVYWVEQWLQRRRRIPGSSEPATRVLTRVS